MSSAQNLAFVICLTVLSCTLGMEGRCPGKHSVWDKWYDGCNWCVCSEMGPVCTNKSCYRIPVDQCEPVGEKWRDGCYKCECGDSGIECQADTRCLHAMAMRKPFPRVNKLGCVCGLDGIPSCIADKEYIDMVLDTLEKGHGRKFTPNEARTWKAAQSVGCRNAKRWYSGSRRCFCDEEYGEPVCGDPRRVAHRVDSYRFKPFHCQKEQKWTDNCRTCTCDLERFAFCVRIPGCRRNLISLTHPKSAKCISGSRWSEGCRRCQCSSRNEIVCDSSACNVSGNMAETKVTVTMPKIRIGKETIRLTGSSNSKTHHKNKSLPKPVAETKLSKVLIPKFQLPPLRTSVHMVRSFRTHGRKEPDEMKQLLCDGKYKPGEKFYDDCNLCKCTHTGESTCTAILCV